MTMRIVPQPSLTLRGPRPHERMAELVLSFPCFQYKEPIFRDRAGNWSAKVFAAWALKHCYSSGELHAARFILSLWRSDVRWKIGRFDLHAAMGTWDEGNRRAFVRWAERPWWP